MFKFLSESVAFSVFGFGRRSERLLWIIAQKAEGIACHENGKKSKMNEKEQEKRETEWRFSAI